MYICIYRGGLTTAGTAKARLAASLALSRSLALALSHTPSLSFSPSLALSLALSLGADRRRQRRRRRGPRPCLYILPKYYTLQGLHGRERMGAMLASIRDQHLSLTDDGRDGERAARGLSRSLSLTHTLSLSLARSLCSLSLSLSLSLALSLSLWGRTDDSRDGERAARGLVFVFVGRVDVVVLPPVQNRIRDD